MENSNLIRNPIRRVLEGSGSRVVSLTAVELIGIAAILFPVALKSVTSEDLVLFDETAYLSAGVGSRSGSFPNFSDGATYSDIYFLLSFITPDRVGLYFAGRALAAVLFVAGVWLAARLLLRAVPAWIAAAVVALSPAPYTWPGVSGPAAGAVLVGMALIVRWRNGWALGLASVLFWFAAGSRPELTWFALFVSGTSLVLVLVYRKAVVYRPGHWFSQGLVPVVLGSLAFPLLLIGIHGPPWQTSGRAWVAFGQHFALRRASDSEDPWLQSGEVTSRFFPEADGFFTALLINPQEMARHAISNALDAPRVFLSQVFPGSSLLAWISFLSIVITLLVRISVNLRQARGRLASALRVLGAMQFQIPALFGGVLIVFLAVPVLIIFPRVHYQLVFAGALAILLMLVFKILNPGWEHLAIPLVVSALCLTIFLAQGLRQAIVRVAYPAPFAASVAKMIDSGAEFRILSLESGLDTYVPLAEVVSSQPTLKGESFVQYLDRMRINAIFANGTDALAPWSQAPGLDEFLADPGSFGYEPVMPGSRLLLRTENSP